MAGIGRPRLYDEGVETTFIGPVKDTQKLKDMIAKVAARQGVKPSVVIRHALRLGMKQIIAEMKAGKR